MPDIIVPAKPNTLEVPLSLKAATDLVVKHKGKDPDEAFDALAQCAGTVTKAAERVQATCTAILANKLAMPLRAQADARAMAHRIFMDVAPKLDATRRKTEAAIKELQTSTQPPVPKDAVAALYAGEIRTALLRMPQAERARAVQQAINDGDDSFVSAAVLGSAALTGLGKAEAAALSDTWRRQYHTKTVERIERLKSGLDEFNRVSSLLSSYALGLLAKDEARISAAEKSEQLAKALSDRPFGRPLAHFD